MLRFLLVGFNLVPLVGMGNGSSSIRGFDYFSTVKNIWLILGVRGETFAVAIILLVLPIRGRNHEFSKALLQCTCYFELSSC